MLGLAAAAGEAAAQDSAEPQTAADQRLADYGELQRWAFTSPRTLSAEGFDIRLDAVHLRLESGTVRHQTQLSDGRRYGMVFEGDGRLLLEVPDPFELRQLRRFTKREEIDAFEVDFSVLVMATSDPDQLPAAPADAGGQPLGLAKERHEHWMRQELVDADAHIIEALSDPQGSYTRIDLRTKDWGWLTLTFDARRREELELVRFNSAHKSPESWVSLDRAEDRLDTGRPSPHYSSAFSMPHAEVEIDVSQRALESPLGFSNVQPLRARLTAALDITSNTEGLRVLRLVLSPRASVTSIVTGDGTALGSLRDPVGKRFSSFDRDIQDDSLVVLLPRALAKGEEIALAVAYEMRLDGYAPGRSWYPAPDGPVPVMLAPHTSAFEITHRKDQAVRASGELEWEGDDTARWSHERPVKMTSFSAVGKAHETVHQIEGAPAVHTFASLGGYMNEDRVDQVGSDVASAVHYFQQLFDDPLPVDELRSTLIPAFHGQAFDGFLHIADFTVSIDSIAATTMFRAHEVAHQWWGHRVLWASYRDQWLSEAFAEYSAMMFVHDAVENGPAEFREVLQAYTHEVTGSIKSAFSRYSRPDYTPMTQIGLERIGPIGHGHRCSVAEAPSSYFTQTYLKGSLVLHMLRTLVGHMTKNPAAFVDILRNFIDRHGGSFATTEDFIAVVEETVPADWTWFFDQWVYGAEIPTYVWSYEIARGSQQPFELRLHVEQKDVPPGFKMAVPVEITFSKDRVGTALAFVNAPSKDFVFPLPERPKDVVFNPDNAVIARTKKK